MGEMKSAQAGAKLNTQPRAKDDKSKFIIIGGIMGVAALAVIILLATSGGGDDIGDCKQLKDPILISGCLAQYCTFDTKQCTVECPLGYEVDEKFCTKSCECAGSGLLEGDVQFNENQAPDLIDRFSSDDSSTSSRMAGFDLFAGSTIQKIQQWPTTKIDGRVNIAYELGDDIKESGEHVDAIEGAIKILSQKTCIDFVPKKNEAAYIKFQMGGGCSSLVGKIPGEETVQEITLGYGCQTTGIAIHEMMHALGFFHEQSRPDRDTFINVIFDNIEERFTHNFKKIEAHFLVTFDSEYDTNSIMHYPSNAFTIDMSKPSITRKSDDSLIERINEVSAEDVNEINLYYECLPKSNAASWGDWGEWTKADKTCGSVKVARFRKCLEDGQPASGCEGDNKEIKNDELEACPAEPPGNDWDPWSGYSKCTRKCAGGVHFRHRYCFKGGCKGKPVEMADCNTQKCLVNPEWGKWEEWSECTASCGGGVRTSKRHCWEDDDRLVTGCEGSEENFQDKTEECNTAACEGGGGSGGGGTGSVETGGSNTGLGIVGQSVTIGPTGAVFSQSPEQISSDICTSGLVDFFVAGDMDADGNTDVFCHSIDGKFYLSRSDGNTFKKVWDGHVDGCITHFKLMVDVNSNKRDAIVCLDPPNKSYVLAQKTPDGKIITKKEQNVNICHKQDTGNEYLSVFSARMKNAQKPVVMCHYGDVVTILNVDTK